MTEETHLSIGSKIGGYEILGSLGSGGMGRVYKVRNLLSHRIEAMKILLPEAETQPHLTSRFLGEIQLLANLNHPNIALLHTAFEASNQLVMILELIEGIPLSERLRAGPVAPAEAIAYAGQILSALSYAHQRGIVHRDIKPANIIITPSGEVKVLDFGIAKSATSPALTAAGFVVGSPRYMAPEVFLGLGADVRSDVYSLGVTLYEMLTGRNPIHHEAEYSYTSAMNYRPPLSPDNVDPLISEGLAKATMKSLAKKPEDRFQTAEEFKKALRDARSGPETELSPVNKWIPAYRGRLMAGGLVLALSLASGQVPNFRKFRAHDSPTPQSTHITPLDRALNETTPAVPGLPPASLGSPGSPTVTSGHEAQQQRPLASPTSLRKKTADAFIPATPVVYRFDSWKNIPWQELDGWFVRRGGGFLIYPMRPPGIFEFSIQKRHGRTLRWVVRYVDDRNYLVFELGRKSLRRLEVHDGKTVELASIPHKLNDDIATLRIDISADTVSHSFYQYDRWTILDGWRQAGGEFCNGSFGFLLTSDDEIGLSNFKFVPANQETNGPKLGRF